MYEYRLALEFWGSVLGLILLAPLLVGVLSHVRQLLKDVHQEVSAPLSSVPSNPHPSWPGC
jgi:hypothetical protein